MKLQTILRERSELLTYVAALAIQRGTLVVMVPVMSRVAGIDGLGLYMLAMAAAYLGAPFLSLSGVPAIFRESVASREKGAKLYFGYMVWAAALTLVCLGLSVFLPVDQGGLGVLASAVLAMAFAEAQNQMAFTVLRVQERSRWFFGGSVARILTSVAVAFAFLPLEVPLVDKVRIILTLQAGAFLLIGAVMMWAGNLWGSVGRRLRTAVSPDMWAALRYTVPMIPHNASLWAINAMGRFFVFRIEGDTQAGFFGGISSIASICALFNVAVSTLLPKPLYGNFDAWIEGDRIRRVFMLLTAAFGAFYVLGMAASFVDRSYMHLMQIYTVDYPWVLALLMLGFMWLVPYYFYGNILIYYRQTWLFSLVTFVAVLIALPVFQYAIEVWGLVGAGIATLAIQMLHAAGMAAGAVAREPRIARHLTGHFSTFVAATLAVAAAAALFSTVWVQS